MAGKPTYRELEERIERLEKESLEYQLVQETLKQEKHYFQSLLNNIHEDIIVIDRNYRIIDVNKKFLSTSGRKRDDVIGQYCYAISHGANVPCEKHGEECMLENVFETGKSCILCHQHIHSEGWKIWVDVLMSPFRDENGDILYVIEAVRDMTDLFTSGTRMDK